MCILLTCCSQVLGFKLKYYHTSRTKAPASLFRMAAQLIRTGHVGVKELYVHLGGTDEEEAKSASLPNLAESFFATCH